MNRLILIFTFFFSHSVLAASLTSTVNDVSVSIEDTITLTVVYSGEVASGEPDFSALENQFSVLSTSQFQKEFIGSQYTAEMSWTLILAPKETGDLLIPSFSFRGEVSDAIKVSVTKTAPIGQKNLRDFFIETKINKESAYVQEQIIVTYRLFIARDVSGLNREEIILDDVIVEELPRNKANVPIDGRTYTVVEFNYALFPQTSGSLEIPSYVWNLSTPIGQATFFGSRNERKLLRTSSKLVVIKPQPAEFPANHTWLPATDLTLDEKWSDSSTNFKIGEPKTLTLTLNAKGLSSVQLPTLFNSDEIGELKVYTEKPILNDSPDTTGFNSSRSESAAILASSPQTRIIPAIRIPWWDTDEDKLKFLEISQKHITVLGDVDPIEPAPFLTPENSANEANEVAETSNTYQSRLILIWQSLTGMSVLMTIIFAYLWWQARNSRDMKQTAAEEKPPSISSLRNHCQQNDLNGIRSALLVWSEQFWPDKHNRPNSLEEIASRMDTKIASMIRDLDRAIYSTDTKFDGHAFFQEFERWTKDNKPKTTASIQLQPLYPAA